MFELNVLSWVLVALSSITVGVVETGTLGVGVLVVPLMATALPTETLIGFVLGIPIAVDLFAICHYFKQRNVTSRLSIGNELFFPEIVLKTR